MQTNLPWNLFPNIVIASNNVPAEMVDVSGSWQREKQEEGDPLRHSRRNNDVSCH